MTAEKPSDFVEEAASAPSAKRRWFKILGIGCAGIMVLVGILFAAGAFKAASCCGDVGAMGQNTQQAAFQANMWAGHVIKERDDQAYALFSPELQAKLDLAAFTAQLAPHRSRIGVSVPMVDKISPVLAGEGKDLDAIRNVSEWDTIVRFYPDAFPSAEPSEIIITLHQRLTPQSTKDKPAISITSFELKTREINYAQEEPALRVLSFHRVLQREGLVAAYGRLAPEFQQATDQETFATFIKEQAPILLNGDLEIRQVNYRGDESGYLASVVAAVTTQKGARALVTYELKRIIQSWGIVGISPLIESTGAASPDASPSIKPDHADMASADAASETVDMAASP